MQKKGKTIPFNKYLEKLTELEKKETDKKNSDKVFIENRYLYSLLKITKSINTPQDFNLLLELIVDSAIAISKAERGFLMLFRKDGKEIKYAPVVGLGLGKMFDRGFEVAFKILESSHNFTMIPNPNRFSIR